MPGITGPSRLNVMECGLEAGSGVKERRITVHEESAKIGGMDTGWAKITDFHYPDMMDEKEIIWTVTMPVFKVTLSKATALLSPILSHIGLHIPPGCLQTSISTCGPGVRQGRILALAAVWSINEQNHRHRSKQSCTDGSGNSGECVFVVLES